MSKSKHTPGPWECYENSIVSGLFRREDGRVQGDWIADIDHDNQDDFNGECSETADANARFIVLACNSHDELVEALRFARQFVVLAAEQGLNGALNTLEFVDAALAKARGEAK